MENAFTDFGGAPETLVIDNLKAAVAHPDWFDPELVPKLQSFSRHYGTVILPTRAATRPALAALDRELHWRDTPDDPEQTWPKLGRLIIEHWLLLSQNQQAER